jgi:hypothetical protein
MDEFEIRHYLKKKYPDLPINISLDIHYSKPQNNIINYDICYWQENIYISLIENKKIIPIAFKSKPDLPSTTRDPDKTILLKHLNTTKKLDITNPTHFLNSVTKHYGIDNFVNTINNSNLRFSEKNILKSLLVKNKNNQKKTFDKILIDTENKYVMSQNNKYTYFDFFNKYLEYNYIFSWFYTFGISK